MPVYQSLIEINGVHIVTDTRHFGEVGGGGGCKFHCFTIGALCVALAWED